MKKILSILLILSLLFSIAGCGKSVSSESADAAPADTALTRVIPSGPLAQMMLLALAPDLMVGIASKWDGSASGYLSEELLSLPYIGRLFDAADTNLETLALLSPHLIIDIGEESSASEEERATLEAQTGIPTAFIPATLKTIPDAFRELGQLLDRQERAEELAQFCERIYANALSVIDTVGSNKVDTLYLLGADGLNVIAKDSYHAELLDLLTNNIAIVDSPSSKGLGNAVSMEQIALWDPEVILYAPDSIYNTCAELETWRELQAISTQKYVQVPTGPYNWMGNPPGVQRYLSLIWLPALLYPQYCQYDVKAEILRFYELFYGCTLSEAQYNRLMEHAFFPGE